MSEDTSPMPLEHGDARFDKIEAQLTRGQARMTAIETGLAENTAATKRIESNTEDLVAAFKAVQGVQAVLLWLVKMAIPLAIVWAGMKAYTAGLFK